MVHIFKKAVCPPQLVISLNERFSHPWATSEGTNLHTYLAFIATPLATLFCQAPPGLGMTIGGKFCPSEPAIQMHMVHVHMLLAKSLFADRCQGLCSHLQGLLLGGPQRRRAPSVKLQHRLPGLCNSGYLMCLATPLPPKGLAGQLPAPWLLLK